MFSKYPADYCCIVTSNKDNWYCKNCKKAHNRLYVNNENDKKYCPSCVPSFIKAISTDINEKQERI